MILYGYLALLLTAAACDVCRLRIPNAVSLALVGLFLAAAALDPLSLDWTSHLGAALLVFLIGLPLFRFGLFGGGDVKLLAATSLWIGWEHLLMHALLVALLGGGLALSLVLVRGVVALLRALSPAFDCWPLPRVLRRGEGIPYGVAIAGSAILLRDQAAHLEIVVLGSS